MKDFGRDAVKIFILAFFIFSFHRMGAQKGQSAVSIWPPKAIAPLPHGEGARRMGERLRAIFAATDWKAEPNKQAERIPYYENLLKQKLNVRDEVTVRMELGNEQLARVSARMRWMLLRFW